MFMPMFKTVSRRVWLTAGLALGLAQIGCAHPVAVQPSVVISSQIGHAPVYAQIGLPGPVMVVPPPRVVYAPAPRVIYAPPVYGAAPGWGHGHRHGHAYGHGPHGAKGGAYGRGHHGFGQGSGRGPRPHWPH